MIDAQAYRLGVRLMDFQHERLAELINRLADERIDLPEALEGLSAYAQEHFTVEEALMEAHGYPATTQHLAQHFDFHMRFKNLSADGLQGSQVARRAMLGFLERWWGEHIGGTDRHLAAFLRGVGMHDPPDEAG